jgi:hypothetical protein
MPTIDEYLEQWREAAEKKADRFFMTQMFEDGSSLIDPHKPKEQPMNPLEMVDQRIDELKKQLEITVTAKVMELIGNAITAAAQQLQADANKPQ